MSICERRAHFIDNLREEGPFYWQFERAGTILLGKFRRRLVEFLIMSKTMLAFGWSFILWSKALPGRLVVYIKLFLVWLKQAI